MQVSFFCFAELFLKLCHILLQADHQEKGLSLLQALTELSLFLPALLHQASLLDRLEILQPFWDSGMARVGERGARGWGSWVQSRGEGDSAQLMVGGKGWCVFV